MNKKYLRNSTDDEEESSQPVKTLGYTSRYRTAAQHRVRLNQPISDATYYGDIFELLIDCSEDDLVDFFIASPGGDIEGLSILIEGVRLSDAHCRAVLLGSCDSAASIFALNCPETIVTDSATMLVHNVKFGFLGKAADNAKYVDHVLKSSERLLRSTYEGFLTEEEIVKVLDGHELYLVADEIRERLEARDEYFTNLQETQENEDKPVTIEGTPDVLPTDGRGKGKKKQSPAAA